MNRKLQTAVLSALMGTGVIAPAQAVDIGVFGDVGYQDTTAKGENGSFVIGQFDMYAAAKIGDKTRAFFEYVFENDGTGYVLDLERLIIARKLTDSMELSAGRYHTPIGYWNRTYHHGALLYDTVSRPTFLSFEDGNGAILPVHITGAMLSNAAAVVAAN